jgi:hypothetical protein
MTSGSKKNKKLVPIHVTDEDRAIINSLFVDIMESVKLLVTKMRDTNPNLRQYQYAEGDIKLTIEDADPQTKHTLRHAEHTVIPPRNAMDYVMRRQEARGGMCK